MPLYITISEKLGSKRLQVMLEIAAIAAAYAIAVYLRLIPALKFGFKFTTDDPLLHYKLTKLLLEDGRLPEVYPLAWHPWSYKPSSVLPVFHYYTGAALYQVAKLFFKGLPLSMFASALPPVLGSTCVIGVYLIVRELVGRAPAAFSAYMLATSFGHFQRTAAGWYRHEHMALPVLCFTVYFTIKALRAKEGYKTILYSVISALLLVYFAGLWAGFRFILDGYPLVYLTLMILGAADWKTAFSLLYPPLACLLASIWIPHLSAVRFVTGPEALFAWGTMVVAIVYHLLSKRISSQMSLLKRIMWRLMSLATLPLPVIATVATGLASKTTIRMIRTVNPFAKLPPGSVTATVAEHAPGMLIRDFSTTLVLAALGMTILFTEDIIKEKSREAIFLFLLSLASIYFGASLVRLSPLTAVFVAIVSAYIMRWCLERASDAHRRIIAAYRARLKRKKRKIKVDLTPLTFPIMLITVTVLLAVPPLYRTAVVAPRYSLGFTSDWDDALSWIRENTTKYDVILSWWDYGYWIDYGATRVTCADGNTLNSTQIREIAKAYMGTEEEMLDLCMRFNVSYVLLDFAAELTDWQTGGTNMFGIYFMGSVYPVGKWHAMCHIALKDYRDFIQFDTGLRRVLPTEKGFNTTIFKLGLEAWRGLGSLDYLELVYPKEATGIHQVYIFKVPG